MDDEREIRNLVAAVARRFAPSLRVVTASDAFEAERVVRSENVAGIISDLRMPGRSGLELLSRVADCSPSTRRALMTGYQADVVDGVVLADLGLVCVLRKPFSAADLSRAILALATKSPVG